MTVSKSRQMTKRGIVATLGLLALLLAGCAATASRPPAAAIVTPAAEAEASTGRGAGGTLRILFWQAPTTLNPHLTTRSADWSAAARDVRAARELR